jgi:hypothetical protein
MKKIIYKSILLIASILCLQSCEKDDIMYYEGGSAAHFLSTTQNHSFLLTLEQTDEIMTIPVYLVGNPVNKDLNLSYEVINEEETGYTTTATADQYEFVEAKIPAGEQQGWIKVRVKNPNKLNIGTPTLYLSLKLKDNDEIKAGGWLDYLKIKLTWSSDVVKPYSWNSMRYFICSTYSSNVYRGYIESTGLLEMYYSLTPAPDGSYWTQNQCWVLGQKFGNWVRQWNKDHAPEVYSHDDGDKAGLPIEPLY